MLGTFELLYSLDVWSCLTEANLNLTNFLMFLLSTIHPPLILFLNPFDMENMFLGE